jgi:L-alanine-DL-glutamate epimerase-like enolase superfamily enzyme
MSEDIDRTGDAQLAVGARVRMHRGQSTETAGTVVEDFGDMVGVRVDVGETQIADPARRWAVALDDGGLMFLDSEHLTIV